MTSSEVKKGNVLINCGKIMAIIIGVMYRMYGIAKMHGRIFCS